MYLKKSAERCVRIGSTLLAVWPLVMSVEAKKPPPPGGGEPTYTQVNLGTLGGTQAGATDINEYGEVVGSSSVVVNNQEEERALLIIPELDGAGNPIWFVDAGSGRNALMLDLGVAGAYVVGNNVYRHSSATAINDLGMVIGETSTSSSYSSPFIIIPHYVNQGPSWFTDGNADGFNDLMMILSQNGEVNDVNNSGQVVGSVDWTDASGQSETRAVLITPVDDNEDGYLDWVDDDTGGNVLMKDLGHLGGIGSSATGINDAGQVVGWAGTIYHNTWHVSFRHAFRITPEYADGGSWRWNRDDDDNNANDLMEDLGTLTRYDSSASAVNEDGVTVGTSHVTDDHVRAILVNPDEPMVDLGALPGHNEAAEGSDLKSKWTGGGNARL